jgi:GTP cyclohydrolase IA
MMMATDYLVRVEASPPATRNVTDQQMEKFEGYAAEILSALGLDLQTVATKETPRRFIRALFDATDGYEGNPILVTFYNPECSGGIGEQRRHVIEGPIRFLSICERHALPFFGTAYVGYLPNAETIGTSDLTRLVRQFAKRFTIQERIGHQIAKALQTLLSPSGVAVYLEAQPLCAQTIGLRESSPLTRTTHWRGDYTCDPELLSDFFSTCGLPRL